MVLGKHKKDMADREGSKKQLLDVAKTLFSQKGLEGVTVRDIASKSGMSLCLISYHFGGKEKTKAHARFRGNVTHSDPFKPFLREESLCDIEELLLRALS